jgi:hypothetical protein
MEVISRRWYDLELLSDGNVEQRVHEGGLGDDVVPADPLHLSLGGKRTMRPCRYSAGPLAQVMLYRPT